MVGDSLRLERSLAFWAAVVVVGGSSKYFGHFEWVSVSHIVSTVFRVALVLCDYSSDVI